MTTLMDAPAAAPAGNGALDDVMMSLRARRTELFAEWQRRAAELRLLRPFDEARRPAADALLDAFLTLVEASDRAARTNRAHALVRCLTRLDLRPSAAIGVILVGRDAAIRTLRDAHPDAAPDDQRLTAFEHAATHAITAAAACLTRAERAAHRRSAASAGPRPLVALLTGPLDPTAAPRLTEHLLDAVRRARATLVVIDLTPLSTLDTATTDWVTLTAEAARWLGASVVVCGAPGALTPPILPHRSHTVECRR